MMHHELCDGRDLAQCLSCARNVARFSATVVNYTTTRLSPIVARRTCADWLEAPTRTQPKGDEQ